MKRYLGIVLFVIAGYAAYLGFVRYQESKFTLDRDVLSKIGVIASFDETGAYCPADEPVYIEVRNRSDKMVTRWRVEVTYTRKDTGAEEYTSRYELARRVGPNQVLSECYRVNASSGNFLAHLGEKQRNTLRRLAANQNLNIDWELDVELE